MATPQPDAGPFGLLRELIRDLAAEAPAQLDTLLDVLDLGSDGAVQRAIDAALLAVREMEAGGPERISALIEGLMQWAASSNGLEGRIKPIIAALGELLANVSLADGGEQLDAVVMPWVERLSEACVAAIMGEPS
jgi:ABC-type transporter Mla subunit MlaD